MEKKIIYQSAAFISRHYCEIATISHNFVHIDVEHILATVHLIPRVRDCQKTVATVRIFIKQKKNVLFRCCSGVDLQIVLTRALLKPVEAKREYKF